MTEKVTPQVQQAELYVHPKAAWDKLREAGKLRKNVYVYGATGYGKTEMLRRYLRRKKHIWLSAEGLTVEKLNTLELPQTEAVVVIDDLTAAHDPLLLREIARWLQKPDVWLLLAGRCPLPGWLSVPYVSGQLTVIEERDLWLDDEQVSQLYLNYGIQLPRELIQNRILPLAKGNPLATRLLAAQMQQGSECTEELIQQLERKFYEYLNYAIYDLWPQDLCDAMMQLSTLRRFKLEQAEELTGRSDMNLLLSRAEEMGNFFTYKDEVYTLRDSLVRSMELRLEMTYDRAQKNALYLRAGAICEKVGDIPRAMEFYQAGGSQEKIYELLVDNARRYPGGGYYYELGPAYLALPEEQVRSSPDLIGALAMLHSLTLNASESERWYGVLREYLATHTDPEEQKLAEGWLVYLDISLPHRGTENMIQLLCEAGEKIRVGHLQLPSISMTGGQPYLINGSKDVSEWAKNDTEIAEPLYQAAREVFGPCARSLISLGQAEILFEKAGDPYRVLELTNRGLIENQDGGKFELQFVGASLMARCYMVTGKLEECLKLLDEMELKGRNKCARHIVRNIRAMRCRVRLWQGRVEDAAAWMETEPPDEIRYNVVERYRYATRVRVYLAQQRYDKAVLLLSRLHGYAEMEKRPWLQMESHLLESIVRYRTGDERWEEELNEALTQGEEYGFVRLFAREGAALLPLLRVLEKNGAMNSAYRRSVLEHTEKMAQTYPQYLTLSTTLSAGAVQLSEKAIQVLRLLAVGCSRGEIAYKLGVSERSVKYQSEQAYHKLGATNRMEAIEAARKLNLL